MRYTNLLFTYLLRTKLGEGLGLGEHPKNWDPYLFLQP